MTRIAARMDAGDILKLRRRFVVCGKAARLMLSENAKNYSFLEVDDAMLDDRV